MKEILGYVIGAFLLAISWFISWLKISSLKAKNKQLNTEKNWEKEAKESKVKEAEELTSVDKKSDEEIFSSWNKKKNEK